MRVAVASSVALLILCLPVSAYTSSGTDPTATSPTLYVHRNSADAAYWLSNVVDEPDADDPDPGYNVLGIAPLEAAGLGCGDAAQYCWQIVMDPAPAADIVLDATQPTKFHLIYRTIASVPNVGNAGGVPGYGAISATLFVDGQALASVAGPDQPTSGEFETVDLEGETAAAVIPAGAEVMLDIRFDGVSGGALLGADGTHEGNTHVTLPVVGGAEPGPQRIAETLETASVSHTFANATSDTYVLNFTTTLDDPVAVFDWNASAGSVAATLTDANGTVVHEGTFEGADTATHALAASAGDWSLRLAYAGFNGTFAFALQAPVPPEAPAPEPEPEPEPETNTTTEPFQDVDDSQDTPLPAWLPVALLAAALVRRRL